MLAIFRTYVFERNFMIRLKLFDTVSIATGIYDPSGTCLLSFSAAEDCSYTAKGSRKNNFQYFRSPDILV